MSKKKIVCYQIFYHVLKKEKQAGINYHCLDPPNYSSIFFFPWNNISNIVFISRDQRFQRTNHDGSSSGAWDSRACAGAQPRAREGSRCSSGGAGTGPPLWGDSVWSGSAGLGSEAPVVCSLSLCSSDPDDLLKNVTSFNIQNP